MGRTTQVGPQAVGDGSQLQTSGVAHKVPVVGNGLYFQGRIGVFRSKGRNQQSQM
jgi:hypothetical protein